MFSVERKQHPISDCGGPCFCMQRRVVKNNLFSFFIFFKGLRQNALCVDLSKVILHDVEPLLLILSLTEECSLPA